MTRTLLDSPGAPRAAGMGVQQNRNRLWVAFSAPATRGGQVTDPSRALARPCAAFGLDGLSRATRHRLGMHHMWSFELALHRSHRHIDYSSCNFAAKYGAGKRGFGVVVSRDCRATLCSCLFVIIPAVNNAGAGGRNVPSAIDASHIDPRAFGLVKVAYGVGETLELLSIGRTSLYAAVKRGELTPVKFGKKSLFYATDLAAFLTKLKGAASDAASAAESVSGTGSDHHSSGA